MDTQECNMTSSGINLDTDLLAGLEVTEKRKYYVARYCPAIDHMESVDLMWNMYGLMVFSIKEEWVRELVKLTGSYEEVTELLAKYGTKHFAEIRATVKVTDEDPLSTSDEYAVSIKGPKTEIVLPKERIDAAIEFMKLGAKLIIEDEYDRRFLSLKAEESKIEQYMWASQLQEANNLSGETPLLNNLATIKGITVAEMAKSVIDGQASFHDKVSALYRAMVGLKQEFKNCATIKEINVLWEKYLGIPMPQQQAIELGNTEEDNWTPLPIKQGLQF